MAELVHPYVIGTGENYSEVTLFTREELSTATVLTTPSGQSVVICGSERIDDFFESFYATTIKIVGNDPNEKLDPRVRLEKQIKVMGFARESEKAMMSSFLQYAERILMLGKPRATGSNQIKNIYGQADRKTKSEV